MVPPSGPGRAEFGHWEMDTIVFRVGGRGGLLVLIERKTRRYLVRKLPVLSQDAVFRAVQPAFRLFFTHAYASWEKGGHDGPHSERKERKSLVLT
ncbi:MAG: hypothetical protein IJP66_02540 [Kiritimatiellae bacterium]|nr:hypothetical protein [Kiritimatiellia bacterium]MBR0056184.1 hypothetical protein [Kiritimatiellia bacterium]